MNIPGKTALCAAGAAGLLALGVAGAVLAQDPGPRGGRGEAHQGLAFPFRISLYEIVEASGIDSEVFRVGFGEGRSINETLVANGLDPAGVQAEVLGDLEAALDERVAAGDLDQARAGEILANSSGRLARFMAGVPDGDGPGRPAIRFAAGRGVVESAADTIGITVRELLGEVRETDGSIASVAEAHGVEPQTVIDNAVAKAVGRIDEAEASRNLTPERAAELRENARDRIAAFVNGGPRFGQRFRAANPE